MANSTNGAGRKAGATANTVTVADVTVTVAPKIPFRIVKIIGDGSGGLTADKIDEFLKVLIGAEQTERVWDELGLEEGKLMVEKILEATGIAGESSASPTT